MNTDPNDSLHYQTVEDRLIGSLARMRALADLAEIRAKHERPDWSSVQMFANDTLNDLRAIEHACENSVWGRAMLSTTAPTVPEGGG